MSTYANRIVEDQSAEVLAYHSLVESIPDTVDLSMGEVLLAPPEWLRLSLSDAMKTAPIGYVSPQGILSLRQTFAQYLKTQGFKGVSEENVLITSGAKEAAWLVFFSHIQPGDKVLLPQPGWPPYITWARALGAHVSHYDPSIPAGEITNLLHTFMPSLLVLNYPNNPTGFEITQLEMKEICNSAKELGVMIISDEVYRAFSSISTPPSVLGETDLKNDNFFYVDSVSKMLGLAGLRVGFLVSSPDSIHRLTRLRASHAACVCSIAQWAVNDLLQMTVCRKWMRQLGQEIKTITRELSAGLKSNGFEVESAGGMYVWLKRNNGLSNDYLNVIKFPGAAVKVAPGVIFGSPTHFRICTARSRSLIRKIFSSN